VPEATMTGFGSRSRPRAIDRSGWDPALGVISWEAEVRALPDIRWRRGRSSVVAFGSVPRQRGFPVAPSLPGPRGPGAHGSDRADRVKFADRAADTKGGQGLVRRLSTVEAG
jgi:hypothetical protein